jgi:hypothetical protein
MARAARIRVRVPLLVELALQSRLPTLGKLKGVLRQLLNVYSERGLSAAFALESVMDQLQVRTAQLTEPLILHCFSAALRTIHIASKSMSR